MKFVLDASVAVKWTIPEPDSPLALTLLDDVRSKVHEIIAPDTFAVEIAHSLTRAERKGLLHPGEAILKLADILQNGPDLHSALPLLPRAVELSSQMRIGVYDCLYVALAEREQCELVTADSRLVNSMPGFPIVLLDSL